MERKDTVVEDWKKAAAAWLPQRWYWGFRSLFLCHYLQGLLFRPFSLPPQGGHEHRAGTFWHL